jgi:glycosyltransferase involved in cell wall biosynthesis
MAARTDVDVRYVPIRFEPQRRTDSALGKIYSLWDAYLYADFVTYPTLYEGFGNALLETVYFRKPMLVNRYSVYRDDIETVGLKTVSIDGNITDQVVDEVRNLLNDPSRVETMTKHNVEVAAENFSYDVLQKHLHELLANFR